MTHQSTLRLSFVAAALVAALAGCADEEIRPSSRPQDAAPEDTGNGGSDTGGLADEDVTADVTSDTTWSASKRYHLKKFVRVKAPATLTIEAGVTISSGPAAEVLGLAVLPGAKIRAMGTKDKPIVFTSGSKKGSRKPGDWAGLMLLGKAKVNLPSPRFPEGLKDLPEYAYGGDDDGDSSGELHYVRVEYAGYQLSPNNEVNSFSFYGVGRGTKIDHLQAHFGNDDAFEFFGGTVDAKYLVATSATDDCFDLDNGYSGRIQFAICKRDDIAGGGNGFEVDNDKDGSAAAPVTRPTVWNVTLVGKSGTPTVEGGHGMHLRRNAQGSFGNVLVTGWPLSGLFVDGASTEANADAGTLEVKNSLFVNPKNYANAFSEAFASAPVRANATAADAKIVDVRSASWSFALADGSPALSAGAAPPSEFFDSIGKDFIGACGKSCSEFEGWTTKDEP